MAVRPRAIVTGMIASYPLGGVVFDYGQYLLGLKDLGFEVYYLEDSGLQAYDPLQGIYVDDYAYSLGYLPKVLGYLAPEFADRWAVRTIDGSLFGPIADRLNALCGEVDLFLNVSGAAVLREAYMACRMKVLIDTDPGQSQMRNYPQHDALAAFARGETERARSILLEAGQPKMVEKLDNWDGKPNLWMGNGGFRDHDRFFTYAQRIGETDCEIPSLGVDWSPTRPPVVMDLWKDAPGGDRWTTVMSWTGFPEMIRYGGRAYGAKEMEFPLIEALPSMSSAKFEVASGGVTAPRDRWRGLGWRVEDAPSVSATPQDYLAYVSGSRGEISIAKNIYAATRSGWFSCRSVCYLACGAPVVVQDTGFSDCMPTGEGVIGFSTTEQALAGIEAVEANYDRHSRAARESARAVFGADTVMTEILEGAGLA